MIWTDVIKSVRDCRENAFWLISHASYLMKTDGILWGVDLRLNGENHRQADDTLYEFLKDLKVAMLTHLHPDHYDPALIECLAHADIHWIFPAFMPDDQKKAWLKKLGHCTFMKAGDEKTVRGLKIQAFETIHRDYFKGECFGVDEIGYRVEVSGRTYVFPGDVRNYEAVPEILKGADEFFSHVWLGREAALSYDQRMLEAYLDYLACAKAKRIWLGHLNDMDRTDIDRWTDDHARAVKKGVLMRIPEAIVEIPEHGKKNVL